MTMDRLQDLLEPVCEIARAAGREIEGIRVGGADVEHKQDGSPVTIADRASHERIAGGLAQLTPEIPLISEEGDVEKDVGGAPFWLVDPLDGTKEFIKGLGEYTVNIALVRRGDPVLGVVYAPALDKMYWAARGAGARVQIASAAPAPIAPRSSGPLTAAISRSHASEETQTLLEALRVQEVARMGSSLKLCAVADGTADVYPRLGPTYLWDTAAAAAVVREAGAQVYGLDGRRVDYSPRGDLKLPGFIVCAGREGRVPIEDILEALPQGDSR
jgi:3'(2'), 5'-bisphosphate nucleotidase